MLNAAAERCRRRFLRFFPGGTVFPFIAQPSATFLKPNVTRIAAARYGVDFEYHPRPTWHTYQDLLRFARRVRSDVRDLLPQDLIDIQSCMWVQGSDEYAVMPSSPPRRRAFICEHCRPRTRLSAPGRWRCG